jgi:hypothetical protein
MSVSFSLMNQRYVLLQYLQQKSLIKIKKARFIRLSGLKLE